MLKTQVETDIEVPRAEGIFWMGWCCSSAQGTLTLADRLPKPYCSAVLEIAGIHACNRPLSPAELDDGPN